MDQPAEIAVECYARASMSATAAEDTVSALRELHSRDVVDTVGTTMWPDELCMAEHTRESAVFAQYDRLRAWADRMNVSLNPAFTRRTRRSMASDDAEAVLTLPVVCLGISIGGELVTVAPHTGERTYTLSDALTDLKYIPRETLVDAPREHLSSEPRRPGAEVATPPVSQPDDDTIGSVDTTRREFNQNTDN